MTGCPWLHEPSIYAYLRRMVSENNEAIAIYQQMLKVNPNSAKAHFLLANFNYLIGSIMPGTCQ
ncbi:hypothetical protein [Nostoc sp. CALU 1950]|uniref:hypothetical protein n=1 Tax=Nostoc sp. CALU 1950 TaxID=3104321 RepID=UPI003EB792ED